MTFLKNSILCAMLAATCVALHAQTPSQPATNSVSASSSSDQTNVVYIAGLDEVKPNLNGDLRLSSASLTFSAKDVEASISRERIVNVYIGDQRTEPWGTKGKIARKIIPYGGGAALGAITNKKVDLLTVEYLDVHDGYRGVVFVLPTQKASAVRADLLAHLTPPVARPALSCADPLPGSVLLAPIQVSGIQLPDEYRILIYEQLFKELKARRPDQKFLRVGDRAAGPGCPADTLNIKVTDFKKGNRAVRASTGPVGFFIGATSLTLDVTLQDAHDKTVYHSQIKKSNRTDSESLGLADSIARNVAKSLNKATASSTAQVAFLR